MNDAKSERILVPMSKPLLEKIDDYRFEKRMPSRADAIRTLIEKGLDAEKQIDGGNF